MAFHNYSRTFKSLRVVLIQELPDPKVLLDHPAFRDQLSDSNKSQILSPISPCDRAEKLVDVMEFSSQEKFQAFLAALRPLKPELAARVERAQRQVEEEQGGGRGASASGQSNRVMDDSSPSSSTVNANEMHRHRGAQVVGRQGPVAMEIGVAGGRQPQAVVHQGAEGREPQARQQRHVEEDAGIFGLNGLNPGRPDRISLLSYTCREYLASHLNGQPPERNTFHNFCNALGVENKLVQASSRSGNPTGYLLQKFSSRPEATLTNLERALNDVGMGNVYARLIVMLENEARRGGGGDVGEDN